MFPLIFFERSTKESIITASFAERSKTTQLTYRDYETILLNFTIRIVFSLKYPPKKAINSFFRKVLCL